MTTNGHHPPDDEMPVIEPFRTLSLRDLAAYQFPPVEWVVDGVLPAGALVLMVGRPKAGKSLLAIDLLASVALGETFLDKATEQGPALYVPAEDALRLVRDRLWTRLGDERSAPLHVLPADGSLDINLRLDREESFNRLAATVDAFRPRVLVLDPFREFHHGKENDADEMSRLLRPLRQLAHDSDTLIVLIHHRNKHATDPALATRGSSAITGGVDVIVTLELSDESEDATLTPDQVLTLRVEGRYGPRQHLAARLRSGLRWESTDPLLLDTVPTRERVLRHLEVTGESLTANALAEAVKAGRSVVQDALLHLFKAGRILREGAGTKSEPFRYRAAVYQAAYGRPDECPDEYSRMQTRKTAHSSGLGKVYTLAGRTNPEGGRMPCGGTCGGYLLTPESQARGYCERCWLEVTA